MHSSFPNSNITCGVHNLNVGMRLISKNNYGIYVRIHGFVEQSR